MKLNKVMSAIEEWEGELKEAQANFDSANDWESECYNMVVLYEGECDRLPDDKNLESILVNEVYPNYDEAYKRRKEADDRLERAERVMEALKELQAALEDWEA